jgi:enoyl-[acyl-carrier protein] reductase I
MNTRLRGAAPRREIEAPIVVPLDVRAEGQMEAVFECIGKKWGALD